MPTVTLSPDFQVTLPEEIREALDLHPGEELQIFQLGNRIELVPVRPLREMRGFLRGMNLTIERDPDRV
jgi:AbrB family looped-hinge helix DNA binding protein